MKKLAFISALVVSTTPVWAQQEVAKVISVTPIMQQFSVPKQVCTNETVVTGQQKSGAGALMGGIAGGAMGNAVGGGNGKAAATLIGLVGGMLVGDAIEGSGTPQTQNVQRCTNQYVLENRITSYSVIYEFGGKQYTVQMPNDPGPTIKLQLTPVSSAVVAQPLAAAPAPAPDSTVTYAPAPQPVARYTSSIDPALVVLPVLAMGLAYSWHNPGVYYRPHHRR